MDTAPLDQPCTAFRGDRRIARGPLGHVVSALADLPDHGGNDTVALFDDRTGRTVEVDWRGASADVVARLAARLAQPLSATPPQPAGDGPRAPGRPRLGVVAGEVTLLPRHWDWLRAQPGGASAALRRLVDAARRDGEGRDAARDAQVAAHAFMTAMAGDLPGYEEALRALYAADPSRFAAHTDNWPGDVRDYARDLAGPALRARDDSAAPPSAPAQAPRS